MKDKVIKLKGKASIEVLEELWQRWNKRNFSLKQIVLDESQPKEKRFKANVLHSICYDLLIELFQATLKATQINTGTFEHGGVVGEVHAGEAVINKR